jgi:hypothetical protein
MPKKLFKSMTEKLAYEAAIKDRQIEKARIKWEKWHQKNGIKDSDGLSAAQLAILDKLKGESND